MREKSTNITETHDETPAPAWVFLTGKEKEYAKRCWVIEQVDTTDTHRTDTWENDVLQMLHFVDHGRFPGAKDPKIKVVK